MKWLVGWTKPRDIFPTYRTYTDPAEAKAAHKLALRIDPNATIELTQEPK